MIRPPRALTVAGSDSGGGAGIQADLKTFSAHGVYGMSALTAVTAQNTRAVSAIEALSPELVTAQIDTVCSDLGVDAVKIGMLADATIVAGVADAICRWAPPWVVLDPVMIAQSGAALLADDAVAVLVDQLVPLASIVTPNLPEAARISGLPVGSEADRIAAARRLIARGANAVLIKDGHGDGAQVVDLLVVGERVKRFVRPRLETTSTHGTGCTLSAAIAARLARGEELIAAVAGAGDYLHAAIAAAPDLGTGHGPVEHDPRKHRPVALRPDGAL